MNKYLFTIFFVTVFFSSCNWESENDDTPSIYLYVGYPLLNSTDVLSVNFSPSGYVLDTINPNDTVRFFVGFYTYSNNMQEIRFIHDNEVADIEYLLDHPMDSMFRANGSNYEDGYFYLPENIVMVNMQFNYIAKRTSNRAKLEMQVTSDSKYSMAQFSLITPIKAKEVVEEEEDQKLRLVATKSKLD